MLSNGNTTSTDAAIPMFSAPGVVRRRHMAASQKWWPPNPSQLLQHPTAEVSGAIFKSYNCCHFIHESQSKIYFIFIFCFFQRLRWVLDATSTHYKKILGKFHENTKP